MAGEMIIAGIPNILQGASATVGGVTLSPASICDQEPSSYAEAASNLPSASSFLAHSTALQATVDFVAIVNHNLDRKRGPASYDSSYWRVIATSAIPLGINLPDVNYYAELYPTSLVDSNGVTGTYTAVDDTPFLAASMSDYIGASGAESAAMVDLGFNTPASPLSACTAFGNGVNDHAFVIRADSSDLEAVLIDDGVEIRVLTTGDSVGEATDPYGRSILILPFSSGELTSANGANVRVKITGFRRLYSVLWSAGVYPAASPTPTYDSGWIAVQQNTREWATLEPAPPSAKGYQLQPSDLHVLPTALTVATVSHSPLIVVSMLNQAGDDRLNRLGVLAAGSKWQPVEGKNFQALTFGISDASKKTTTFGGQDLPSARNRRRMASFVLPRVTPGEMAELFQRIDVMKGTIGAFLVSLYPDDTYLGRIMTFWCTLDENNPTQWAHSPMSVQDTEDATHVFRFDRQFNLKEKI